MEKLKSKIKPAEKMSFASFFFGQGLIYAFAGGSYLLLFLTDYALINPFVVSAIMLVGKIWDAVNDTLFGLIVDKTRFKSGNKYKPWLWIATFSVPILMLVMFCVNPSMSMTMRIVLFSLGYFLWDTAYTICDAPAFALVTSMTDDVKERVKLTTFANIGGVLATGIFAIAIVPFLDKFGFFNAALLIAPISMVMMIFLCIFAKERTNKRYMQYQEDLLSQNTNINAAPDNASLSPLQDDESVANADIDSADSLIRQGNIALDTSSEATELAISTDATAITETFSDSAVKEDPPTFRETLRYLAKNKYMLIFYLYRIISGALFIQFMTYITKHYFGDLKYVTYIMLVSIPLIIGVYALSGLITKRFNKITIYRTAMIASMVINVVLFFAARNNVWIYVVGMALYAAINILPSIFMTAIPGDCAEYGTYKTGTHNEGITFSLQTFTAKITSALSLALSGLLLGLIKYSGDLVVIPQQTLNWIWAIGTLLPVVAQAIGLPILFAYKLKDSDAQLMSDYNHGKISREECESKLSRKY